MHSFTTRRSSDLKGNEDIDEDKGIQGGNDEDNKEPSEGEDDYLSDNRISMCVGRE